MLLNCRSPQPVFNGLKPANYSSIFGNRHGAKQSNNHPANRPIKGLTSGLTSGLSKGPVKGLHDLNYRIFRAARRSLLIVFVLLIALSVNQLAFAGSLINVNTATASMLAQSLPGIGPAKAEAIVQYRVEHGAFETVAALTNVKGIGPRTLEKIRDLLTIGQSTAPNDAKANSPANKEAPSSKKKAIETSEAITTNAVRAVLKRAREARNTD